MPSYPGATRPLPRWESPRLAVAMTGDAPQAVVAFYGEKLDRAGWKPVEGMLEEAKVAAKAGQPVWMTFSRPGIGRLDIQLTRARHPKTGKMVTFIYYRTQVRP